MRGTHSHVGSSVSGVACGLFERELHSSFFGLLRLEFFLPITVHTAPYQEGQSHAETRGGPKTLGPITKFSLNGTVSQLVSGPLCKSKAPSLLLWAPAKVFNS